MWDEVFADSQYNGCRTPAADSGNVQELSKSLALRGSSVNRHPHPIHSEKWIGRGVFSGLRTLSVAESANQADNNLHHLEHVFHRDI